MKKVLFVTYFFPPSGGSKTRRTLKFLKYLEDFGWRPVVLTSEGGRQASYDPLSLDQVPEQVSVYKAPAPAAWLRRLAPRRPGAKLAPDADGDTTSCPETRMGAWKRYLRQLPFYLGIPDGFIVWAPAAVYRGVKLLNAGAAEVIYSTGPPFSNFLIAVLLKKITGKPLIVDFRDAWIAEPARAERRRRGQIDIGPYLEHLAVRQARRSWPRPKG